MSTRSHSRKRSNVVPLRVDPRAANALKYKADEHCALVVGMAREGRFPEEWAAEMGVAMSTMYGWAARYTAFDRACRVAWTALASYWTQAAMSAALGGECNTKILLLILKRRFPDIWGENPRATSEHYMSWVQKARKEERAENGGTTEEESLEDLCAQLKKIRERQGVENGE